MKILGIPFLFFLPQKSNFFLAFFERKLRIICGCSALLPLPKKFYNNDVLCDVGLTSMGNPIFSGTNLNGKGTSK
jgi:hypothetical protein